MASAAKARSTKVMDTVLSTILKPDYISVVLKTKEGIVPFQLTPSHSTFKQLSRAIANHNVKRIPALVTIARAIANKSYGKVTFNKGGVSFRGNPVPEVITRLATRALKETGSASAWLLFVENLYKNPEARAREELVEFLEKAEKNNYPVPLTDDGCFLAYKAVNNDYTDCHTGTVNNSIGETPMMPRKAVDPDRRNECSRGYHFCSMGYLGSFGGQKIMAVKVNPKHVVAIPRDYDHSKGRTWTYEVVYEVASKTEETSRTHAPIMQRAVVPVAKERQALLKELLAIPSVKRAIRRKKIALTTIKKQSYGQLVKLHQRFAKANVQLTAAPEQSTVLRNMLKPAREAANLTIGQIAKELDVTKSAIYKLEKAADPRQDAVDKVLEAIAHLTTGGTGDRAMVTVKTPMEKKSRSSRPAPAYAVAATSSRTDSTDYGYESGDDEDEDSDY